MKIKEIIMCVRTSESSHVYESSSEVGTGCDLDIVITYVNLILLLSPKFQELFRKIQKKRPSADVKSEQS